ncbi:sugar ABC transporter ATP-binding protein [Mycobacterium sp. 21AC1]|uniref:sugar ABC transporter ATP-binding protein n=1 Tax=[Mycobacterium] appelbergii TaxID=2939269 RepID=UPI0029392EEF|nr:sugar ABC transporter ATP-binding protein [Mycobacterium sp. 21AC1]MDV3126151.1 sugar ABC transporter ATP-binding protein [Mycobacterium sp. 21AC1]
MAEVVLEMQAISKSFPGVRALSQVGLEVEAGEVHCLLGQNGAGKSTLIKVLAGVHRPDEGRISVSGRDVEFDSPTAAMVSGIATMYQELDLVDHLSVAANVFLGHEKSSWGFTRRSDARTATAALLARLGHSEISPGQLVEHLSPAGKQIVSMARALSREARIIVMDEPSAVLSHDEVVNLFRIIREVTAAGVAVVYISHRLEEIREIGDRITVLKDGRTVAAGLDAQKTTTDTVVSLMSGKTLETTFPARLDAQCRGEVVLDVRNLCRAGEFEDVTFSVRAGEVVGIAGLVGSGRSEILETIFGARRATSGSVSVSGTAVRAGSVRRAMQLGIGLAPEERKSQALLLGESIARNMSISSLKKFSRGGWLDRRKEVTRAHELGSQLDLRPLNPAAAARNLSGGNQQKVVLARWLIFGCKVLLLDEPTRGVDVGARAEIYAMVRELARSGMAIVVVSSEVPEVLGLADRVVVVREGRVLAESAAEELTEQHVLDMVMEGSATVEIKEAAL